LNKISLNLSNQPDWRLVKTCKSFSSRWL